MNPIHFGHLFDNIITLKRGRTIEPGYEINAATKIYDVVENKLYRSIQYKIEDGLVESIVDIVEDSLVK